MKTIVTKSCEILKMKRQKNIGKSSSCSQFCTNNLFTTIIFWH